jgi:hypothetical protein
MRVAGAFLMVRAALTIEADTGRTARTDDPGSANELLMRLDARFMAHIAGLALPRALEANECRLAAHLYETTACRTTTVRSFRKDV